MTTNTSHPIAIPRTTSPNPHDNLSAPSLTSSVPSAGQGLQPHSLPSSSKSSLHTMGRTAAVDSDLNTLHSLAFPGAVGAGPSVGIKQPQEIHILKVTDETVQFQAGPVPDSLLHKVGNSLTHVVSERGWRDRQQASEGSGGGESMGSSTSNVGPPPPSPPSSALDLSESTPNDGSDSIFQEPSPPLPFAASPKVHSSPTIRPVTFEDPVKERQASTSSNRIPKPSSLSRSSQPPLHHRTSGDAKASFRLSHVPRLSRASNQSDLTTASASETPIFTEEPDGFLHPPPPPPPSGYKTPRRNTTGSSTPPPFPTSSSSPPRPSARISTHQAHSSPHVHPTTTALVESLDLQGDFGELASDIQLQAEQIRRERLSKRAKQAAEAEKVKQLQQHEAEISERQRGLTRTSSLVRGLSLRDDRPLVGNLIGEDHVNYVLMYNMLTGIRIAVSRCQAKIRKTLIDEDFSACHKYSFDIVGNELTPSAKYDFKFKDYAPWVFRELREDYFQLDPADYLLSLTAKYILSELGSPGKSGSFFYFSRDYRFIIKTIHHSEHKFLRSILKDYHRHVKDNPHTLLSRFYGLHRVKLPRGRKIHFVIMNNLFPAHKDVHETYDLKGSTVGREYPEEKAQRNPRAVLKDLNWINRGKTLELGPEKRALLTEQLRRDSELLKRLNVMDYSLLVGIHNMARGNRDNVRSNTLKVFSPEMPMLRRRPTTLSKGPSSPEAIALRRIMRESDPKALSSVTFNLPDEDTGGERQYFLFYQNEGGLRATDEVNENMDTIYYLGVIDILTPYSSFKKLEHFWKGLSADRHKISPVPPTEYGDRFFSFMKAIMRGGEGGGRFKAE